MLSGVKISCKTNISGSKNWWTYSVFPQIFYLGDVCPLEFHFRGHVKILGDIPGNHYFFTYCACELFIKCCLEFSSSMIISHNLSFQRSHEYKSSHLSENICVFFLVETASALVEGSFYERFCPTSSSAEDAADFSCKEEEKTMLIVFEQPCFVNKYWFRALNYYRNRPTFELGTR